MASFDENGKYIKTNWKAGDKITATKLNKIEESIEAVNDNDISRHVEADARLDALEAKDVTHDKELTNIKNTIADNKAAAELGDYNINSRMQFLEDDVEQAVNDMNNAVTTIRNEMNVHTNTINTNVDNKISAFETEFDAEVAGLKAVDEALQNDMMNAQTQSFTVTDSYKFAVDHDGMIPSLVTLDNIMGSSEIKINNLNERRIVNTKIKSICTIDMNSKNYFEDMIWLGDYVGAASTRNGNDITVYRSEIYQDNPLAYAFTSLDIPTLTEGKKYCLFCDEVIINDGAPAVELHSGSADDEYDTGKTLNGRDIDISSLSKIFVYSVNRFEFRLHCTVGSQTGNVTYKNIQIYEIKEITVPDIQLNSLPNGVKDEIKDGVYIKRVSDPVKLNTLAWTCSYSDDTHSMWYASLPNIALASAYDVNDNLILCSHLQCGAPNNVDNAEPVGYYVSSHNSNHEVKIKILASDVSSVDTLYSWLASNNVVMQYELATPEYMDVSTSIKVDKGDTVVINTCKPLSCSYDIQLNTRAQLDNMQDLVGNHKHAEYLPLNGGVVNGTIKPAEGHNVDLGDTTNRWKTLYLTDDIQIKNSTDDFLMNSRGFACTTNSLYMRGGTDNRGIYIDGAVPTLCPDSTDSWYIGDPNRRWKTLYCINNPNVSSDRSMKENIEYVGKAKSGLTYSDMYNFVKDDLGLATYNFIGDPELRMNFIAQDLLVNEDGTDNKIGQMIVNPVAVPAEEEIENGTPYPTLSYDSGMYISVLAGALKEAINKIEQLEAKINELENK